MEILYIKNKNDNYKTVNEVLKNEFNISSRLRLRLINNNMIFLNGVICSTKDFLQDNDEIRISFNYDEESKNIVPIKMKLDIIYEDEWLLVVNKPAGIAVHPSILHFEDSLSNGIKFYFNQISLKKKIRPVNRLDKNTSGLVIFAKCEYIQEQLINQMQNNTFKKEYLAIVEGIIEPQKGTIDLPIARKENSIIERCIDKSGQKSITHYEVLNEFYIDKSKQINFLKKFNNIPNQINENDNIYKQQETFSLVKCTLETGRTHQIRVHFKAIGHPLIR
ncbi:MAG: RluA family pseudouridine synthase [Clostridia bacterium]|nr:RluA family pseudouridine synthase [Clostridia bacterium]